MSIYCSGDEVESSVGAQLALVIGLNIALLTELKLFWTL